MCLQWQADTLCLVISLVVSLVATRRPVPEVSLSSRAQLARLQSAAAGDEREGFGRDVGVGAVAVCPQCVRLRPPAAPPAPPVQLHMRFISNLAGCGIALAHIYR